MTKGELYKKMSDLTTAPANWFSMTSSKDYKDYCLGSSINYNSLRKGDELIEIHYTDNKPYMLEITCFNNYTLFTELLVEKKMWLPHSYEGSEDNHSYWECGMYSGKLICTKQ